MNTSFSTPPVVVVGGGLGGLAASVYLARAGVPVQVFEKAPRLGGRAATEQFEGYQINRGIHALYTGGAASQVLQDLGIRYTAGSPKTTCVTTKGALFPFPARPIALLRSRLLGVQDKIELVRVMSHVPQLAARACASTSVDAWLD
jgi:phytoene dehydrogenase-like protein